jgi:MYXO-CTERM domain-containing protein
VRPALLATVLAAGSLTLAAPARAYVRTVSMSGVDIIWPNPAVTLTVRLGGPAVVSMSDFVAAATAAAATWSDPTLASSIAYTIATSSDAPTNPAFDHQNTISFRTSDWSPPTYGMGELALTTVWTQGGRIVDTDTEMNAFDPTIHWAVLPDDPVAAAASGEVDVQNVLTHELGHVLGLDHPCYLGNTPPDPREVNNEGQPVPSCSDPNLPASVRAATMFPSSAKGSLSERKLSPDEIQALHDLYPAGQAPVVDNPPDTTTGGCAVADGPPPASALAALVLGVATLLRARRSRLAR